MNSVMSVRSANEWRIAQFRTSSAKACRRTKARCENASE
jgi:hypothetical protein